MAKIIVTGGAGYVGSHVMWALADAGHHPVAIDDLSKGSANNIKGLDFIPMDYRGFTPMMDFDVFVHCAALTDAVESSIEPAKYYKHNVEYLRRVLDRIKYKSNYSDEKVKFVFTSSAAVYSSYGRNPCVENHSLNPRSAYGRTKMFGEAMLEDFDVDYVVLRPFNVAGADAKKRCGPSGDSPSFFTRLCKYGLNGFSDIPVYKCPKNGYPVRDYIHPTDLAHAYVKAVEVLLSGGTERFYNIGTGRGINNGEVVSEFRKHFPNLTVDIWDKSQRYVDYSVASLRSTGTDLMWAPSSASSLENMVKSTIYWYKYTGMFYG